MSILVEGNNSNYLKGLIIVLLVSVGIWGKQFIIAKIIQKDYGIVDARIIFYSSFDGAYSHTLVYEYYVDSCKYTRSITPSIKFPQCGNNVGICKNFRFPVVYLNSFPSISLIDLNKIYYNEITLDSLNISLDQFE